MLESEENVNLFSKMKGDDGNDVGALRDTVGEGDADSGTVGLEEAVLLGIAVDCLLGITDRV